MTDVANMTWDEQQRQWDWLRGRLVRMDRLIRLFPRYAGARRALHAFARLVLVVDEYDRMYHLPARSLAEWRAAERVWAASRRLIGAALAARDQQLGAALARIGRCMMFVVAGRPCPPAEE